MGNYPEGDTFNETHGASGIPFCAPDVSAPDSRGFSGGQQHVLATGAIRVDGDEVTSRIAAPTYGVGLAGGVGVDEVEE